MPGGLRRPGAMLRGDNRDGGIAIRRAGVRKLFPHRGAPDRPHLFSHHPKFCAKVATVRSRGSPTTFDRLPSTDSTSISPFSCSA